MKSMLTINEKTQCISVADGDKTFLESGKLSDTQLEFFKQHGILLVSGKDIFETQYELDYFINESINVTKSKESMNGPWMYFNMQSKKDSTNKTNETKDTNDEIDEKKEENSSSAREQHKNKKRKRNKRILSRIEKFCEHYKSLNFEFNSGNIYKIVNELFGEKSVLYKEKLNMKYPFDDGFAAHQDHAAGWWSHGHTIHISAFIALDECTIENGCLQCTLNWGKNNKDLVSEKLKGIPKYVENAFKWYNALMKPGDALFFTSFVPHRSFINKTNKPRRVLLPTWNKLSEGDKRNQYYNDKEKSFPPDIKRNRNEEYDYKI